MTDWRKVQGSQEEKPAEFDTTTSKVVVYQRKNIKRITITDMDGKTAELWEYEEREMTREEYAIVRTETQQKQIDEATETALTGLMATTDLYEELIDKGVL